MINQVKWLLSNNTHKIFFSNYKIHMVAVATDYWN